MKTIIITVLFLAMLLTGWTLFEENETECTNSQGTISYEIEYLDLPKNHLLLTLLPKNMEISYRDKDIICQLHDATGFFKMTQIYNDDKNTITTLVKAWNKKYICNINASECENIFGEMYKLMLEKTKETKTIAGFNCQKITAYAKDNTKPIELYYTNELKVKNANAMTPFRGIDGVLLDFQIMLCNFNLRLTAKEIKTQKIDNNKFEIPDDYEQISRQELEKIMKTYKTANT